MMPSNEDVRALVAMAGERTQSVRAEGRAWQDRLASRRAVEGRRGTRGHVRRVPSVHAGAQVNGTRDQTWRLWASSSLFVRSEYTIGKEQITVVVQGPRWWRTSPTLGATSGSGPIRPAQFLLGPAGVLLEPRSLLDHVEVIGASPTEQAGRQAVVLRATPTAVRPRDRMALRAAGTGADEYSITIDSECGFLLRVAALYEGEPFQDVEVTEIGFDETLSPGLFGPESLGAAGSSFKAPVRRLSVGEVVQAVDFQIYLPDPPPGTIAPHIALFEGDQRGLGPKRVVITYPVAEQGRRGQLRLVQTKSAGVERVPGSSFERRGDLEIARDKAGLATRARVRRRMDTGTSCELESTVFSLERLVELATTLRAVTRS